MEEMKKIETLYESDYKICCRITKYMKNYYMNMLIYFIIVLSLKFYVKHFINIEIDTYKLLFR